MTRQIVWDDADIIEKVTGSNVCGCKGAKCDGTTTGCRSCYKMCKPCTLRCKCKSRCRNPHNNGGRCPRCVLAADTDHDDDSDRENEPPPQSDEEVLPAVPPSNNTDFDWDSDSDDDEIA